MKKSKFFNKTILFTLCFVMVFALSFLIRFVDKNNYNRMYQVEAVSSSMQTELDSLLEYKLPEEILDTFENFKYTDISISTSIFLQRAQLFLDKYGNEISSQDKLALEKKQTQADNVNNLLVIKLNNVANETKTFYLAANSYKYEFIDGTKQSELENVQESYKRFYEDEIYISYLDGAVISQWEKPGTLGVMDYQAKIIANEAKTNLTNCLNKAIALNTYQAKKSYFQSEINALPQIVDVTKENKDKLILLKNELKDFVDNYAVHLDNDTKKEFDDMLWRVNKSLEKISSSDFNFWSVFLIALLVFGVIAVIVVIRYGVFKVNNSTKNKR